MKTKYFFLAAIGAMTLASCSNDELVGDNSPTLGANGGDGSIQFTYTMPNATRADIYGDAAAELLGYNFYVMGTKGTEAATSPSPDVVFDNYLVYNKENTAGKTESNTANWEYVGIIPGTTTGCTNKIKLGTYSAQTIKYWDYSAPQYDFFAFSTGPNAAVNKTEFTGASKINDNEIGVTKMKSGTGLAGAVAYSLYIPRVEDLKETFITDIKEVKGTDNYGKEVVLTFKNIGAKIRVALYETVPGYSVKDVKFYASTTTSIDETHTVGADAYVAPTNDATLINANATGFTTQGRIDVKFPYIGDNNQSADAYDKADAVVYPETGERTKAFGAIATAQLVSGQDAEAGFDGSGDKNPTSQEYLGRSLPKASFAGDANAKFYKEVFPVANGGSNALTLRVNYKLVSIDGSKETINVYGATAVVPSTYTQWKPNYAYTYIFKISDNTNGWTNQTATKPGLFPITFDAVVTEATDATGEQKTITTVSAPSITTYQQGHDITKNEYSKSTTGPKDSNVRDIYVQVMNNVESAPGTLVTSLDNDNSLLYAVPAYGKTYAIQPAGWPTGYYTNSACTTEASGSFSSETTYYTLATEAEVMDALQNQTSVDGSGNITGRNGVVLTKSSNITMTGVNQIVNGADDKPITVAVGEASKITIASLDAGTYAYVYDYTTGSKTTVDEYQPYTPTGSKVGKIVKMITTTTLAGKTKTTDPETISSASYGYLYFSKTENGEGTPTYSYISIAGKEGLTLPAGVIKVAKDDAGFVDTAAEDDVLSTAFYFDHYISNNGKYAVKVIKIVP